VIYALWAHTFILHTVTTLLLLARSHTLHTEEPLIVSLLQDSGKWECLTVRQISYFDICLCHDDFGSKRCWWRLECAGILTLSAGNNFRCFAETYYLLLQGLSVNFFKFASSDNNWSERNIRCNSLRNIFQNWKVIDINLQRIK